MSEAASIYYADGEPDELAIAMLVMLLEHKVLSTYQFKVLFFASLRTAQTYVKSLKDRELICTFAWKASGRKARSSERHYLSAAGKAIAARASGRRRPDLIWTPIDDDDAKAGMAHRAGVTAFFCHLIGVCDHADGYGLHLWRPEHKLRSGAVELQPDGAGRLLHPGGAVEFSYEFDRGSEHRSVLRTKLAGYVRVWMNWPSPGRMPIVVWVVPSFEREKLLFDTLMEALERIDPDSALRARPPIYSTNMSLLRDRKHLGAIWQEIVGDATRLRFDELPSVDASAFSLSECLGRRWRERPGN